MNAKTRHCIETSRFRIAPAYELVVFDRLSPDDQHAFAELARDPDFYGLLRPRGQTAHTVKAVSCDAALLLLTLSQPARIPHFVGRDDAALEGVLDLVVGGMLEVEYEGTFLTVESATAMLAAVPSDVVDHPLTRLTHATLVRWGAHPSLGTAQIANALYQSNRQPASPRWERLLPDRAAVLRYVGLSAGSDARRAASRVWDIDGQPNKSPGWIYLSRRDGGAQRDAGRHETTWKLYVSPTLADLPIIFPIVLDVATRAQVRHLKLGSDAVGLLRPDKLVLYFPDLVSLTAVASAIEDASPGISAQGVPFTAPIDATGLLSWGADPPASAQPLSWQPRDSWRTWLTARLGGAIAECRGTDAPVNVACALERLRRDGVDTDRWIGTAALWNAA